MSQQTPYRSTAALWSKKLWGTATGSNERLFFLKDYLSEPKKFPFLPVERKPDIMHIISFSLVAKLIKLFLVFFAHCFLLLGQCPW